MLGNILADDIVFLLFYGENKKTSINLSSAEFAYSTVSVKRF